ncbi:hypothetical protein ACTQ9L_04235 [Deinococcus wulumuqiensis]
MPPREVPRRFFRLPALALLGAALLACAPAPTAVREGEVGVSAAGGVQAAFSDDGVAWVVGGRACVARVPGFRAECPRLAPASGMAHVSGVAWQGGDAWAALPGPGLVVTLDRAPRTVSAGAVRLLSSARIYREDGSTLTYGGERGRGVAGEPQAAVTGGDGREYVVLGRELRRVDDGAVLDRAAQPFLYATPIGAASAALPTASDGLSLYRLTGSALERFSAGQVVARVPHGPGQVGLVRGEVVTVDASGRVRRFSLALEALD